MNKRLERGVIIPVLFATVLTFIYNIFAIGISAKLLESLLFNIIEYLALFLTISFGLLISYDFLDMGISKDLRWFNIIIFSLLAGFFFSLSHSLFSFNGITTVDVSFIALVRTLICFTSLALSKLNGVKSI